MSCQDTNLYHCLLNNKLESANFNQYQSAYRKGHATETALWKVLYGVCTAAYDKKVTALISSDLSAAFDTVDHVILIHRLKSDFGITSAPLTWLAPFIML